MTLLLAGLGTVLLVVAVIALLLDKPWELIAGFLLMGGVMVLVAVFWPRMEGKQTIKLTSGFVFEFNLKKIAKGEAEIRERRERRERVSASPIPIRNNTALVLDSPKSVLLTLSPDDRKAVLADLQNLADAPGTPTVEMDIDDDAYKATALPSGWVAVYRELSRDEGGPGIVVFDLLPAEEAANDNDTAGP